MNIGYFRHLLSVDTGNICNIYHSKTFTELSISHSCCVFRVIVLLEGKPSAQSEVLNALDWVFIKAISVFWSTELFFYSNESLSSGCWKTAPQHKAATAHFTLGWYTAGDVHSWFPSNMMLGIEVHQTRESCFSESEGPLGADNKMYERYDFWTENLCPCFIPIY